MRTRFSPVLIYCLLLCIVLGLAACGPNRIGTIPQGTPDHGNGTPAVIPTPTQPVMTVAPASVGANYAYVRANQLWMALKGASPAQVTHFIYGNTPDVFWHNPVWSPGDHFIAFIMAARPVGQGGGGCPAPDFGANGDFYLLNTATRQLSSITLSSGLSAATGSPVPDTWQYVFWEDATHLLAWNNGPLGKTSAAAGLYRYSLSTRTLTQVLPLSALGATTLYSAQTNLPLLLSMRYSNEQLFYQVIVHPFEQHSSFVIYSHPVTHPEVSSTKVMETGSESWCATQQSAATSYMKTGWDVSADGEQLAAQVVTVKNTTGLSSIQVLDLRDGLTTQLFAQATSQVFGHDLSLTWGPDNQTLVLTTTGAQDQAGSSGLYSATLANPTAIQRYAPAPGGQVAWRPDSSAFALMPPSVADTTSDIYLFDTGTVQGRVLLTDAQNFVWG